MLTNDTTGRGEPGAIADDPDAASMFDGNSAFAATQNPVTGPDVFTEEAWFKTTTTTGGKIVSFGDQNTGTSNNYDRHIYMDNLGAGLVRRLQRWLPSTVNTSKAHNDGQWHHAVGTLGRRRHDPLRRRQADRSQRRDQHRSALLRLLAHRRRQHLGTAARTSTATSTTSRSTRPRSLRPRSRPTTPTAAGRWTCRQADRHLRQGRLRTAPTFTGGWGRPAAPLPRTRRRTSSTAPTPAASPSASTAP